MKEICAHFQTKELTGRDDQLIPVHYCVALRSLAFCQGKREHCPLPKLYLPKPLPKTT